MKKIIHLTIILITSLLVFISCSPFSGDFSGSIPLMPDSLSGADFASSRSKSLSRAVELDYDSLFAEYNNLIIVPELAHNYNNWIEVTVQPTIENNMDSQWDESSVSSFTHEYVDEYSAIRANADFSEYEFYQNGTAERRYLRVKESLDYSHGLLIVDGLSGGTSMDSVEIVETEAFIYSKVVRIHDMNTTPLLQLFVSITDKSTPSNNTSGRYMNYSYSSVPVKYEFPEEPGTAFEVDYWSQEDYPNPPERAVYEIYGFFDDVNSYNISDTIDYAADGYPNPQDLKPYYSQGLNHEILLDVDLYGTFGTGGIEFPEWDEAYIK